MHFLESTDIQYYADNITLKIPIKANAQPPNQNGKFSSLTNAGKCTATKVTWKPQTKNPNDKRLKLLLLKASLIASVKVWLVPDFEDSDFSEKFKKKEKIIIIEATKDNKKREYDQPNISIK